MKRSELHQKQVDTYLEELEKYIMFIRQINSDPNANAGHLNRTIVWSQTIDHAGYIQAVGVKMMVTANLGHLHHKKEFEE